VAWFVAGCFQQDSPNKELILLWISIISTLVFEDNSENIVDLKSGILSFKDRTFTAAGSWMAGYCSLPSKVWISFMSSLKPIWRCFELYGYNTIVCFRDGLDGGFLRDVGLTCMKGFRGEAAVVSVRRRIFFSNSYG